MMSDKTTARVSGLLYLVVVLTGIYSLAYVPKTLFVWDNAALTFKNITASETLFRTGILSSMVCYTAFLFLPIFLYKLLRQVNEFQARIMVVLAMVSVPVAFMNLQHKLAVLSLINPGNQPHHYTTPVLENQVMFYLNQYENGILITTLFWGLWLFPFGYLVYQSGFLPKSLGVLLMLGCLGYLTNLTGDILIEDYAALGISKFVSLPASIGEIGICLWLLIIGVKSKGK
ncbi:MAG TPA: DUF4386 domain-containing protein [Flavobacterium sp.]|jgi:hypothetical protein|nr:DUF4386 domain-containing protein [Flavobacterium sp.]